MHGEVLHDHSTLHQVVEVELLLQRLLHDELLLATIELAEELGGVVLERQLTVILLEARLHLKFLAHEIDLRIIEVDDDSHELLPFWLLIEVLKHLDLVIQTIEDATLFNEWVQL